MLTSSFIEKMFVMVLRSASCNFALNAQATDKLVLIPEGIFRGIDGRPIDAPHWRLTPEKGRAIVAVLNARSIDMLIDYEHAILTAKSEGKEVPASGWLKAGGFEYVDGIGLCSSNWSWTKKAKTYIEDEEYKYLSPFIIYDESGDVQGLINVALTNTPNIDTLPPALLAAAAQDFLPQNSTETQSLTTPLTQSQESPRMDELLEQLRWMLNLPISATAEEIHAELGKLQTQISDKTGVAVAANSQHLFDAIGAIDQLKTAANSQATPDPAKYVPMAVYQEAVAKAGHATTQAQAKELDDLITAACSDGRITGQATIDWIKDQAKTNPAFAKDHINSLPKIAALTQRQTQSVDLGGKQEPQPDDIEVSIATQLGV